MEIIKCIQKKDIALNRKLKQQYRNLNVSISNELDGEYKKLIPFSIKEKDAINIISCLKTIDPQKGLEIGSFCGISTRLFLSEFPLLKMDCVDSWEPFEIPDSYAIFKQVIRPYKNRVTEFQQYFGSRNPNFGNNISGYKTVFYPKGEYDFVFIDGDHRTTSIVLSFMLLKEYTNLMIFHDAFFPQRLLAFEIILKEWSKYWHMHSFNTGEDGVAVFIKK